MKDNITLGQVKARCAELDREYGVECCKHCEFEMMGCCDAPDKWNLEPAGSELTVQPDVEAILRESAELKAENRKLRIIVSVMETMLGRKFDVS